MTSGRIQTARVNLPSLPTVGTAGAEKQFGVLLKIYDGSFCSEFGLVLAKSSVTQLPELRRPIGDGKLVLPGQA